LSLESVAFFPAQEMHLLKSNVVHVCANFKMKFN